MVRSRHEKCFDYLLLILLPLIVFEIILGIFSFSFLSFFTRRFRCHSIIERQNERTADCLAKTDSRLNLFCGRRKEEEEEEDNKLCPNRSMYVLDRFISIVEIIIIITTGIGRYWKVLSNCFHRCTKI